MPENPPEKSEDRVVRDKRRAEALRANLKRRKAQLKGRAMENAAPDTGDSGDKSSG